MLSYRLIALALCGAGLLGACTSVLEVGDAHLDPTFSDPAASSGVAGSGGRAPVGATCKAFDNARVTKLLPGGGLLPLPAAK